MTLLQARRLVIAVIGGTILLLGLVMTVTPGPAIIVIPMGLAILAVEFAWARRLLLRFKEGGVAARKRLSVWWRGSPQKGSTAGPFDGADAEDRPNP